MEEKKFALLIDADNISSKYIGTILEELGKYGVVTYKRLYGDLTRSNNRSWKEALLKYSINPVQHFAYTTGKNSTDSAMIIDAMDILYSGSVNGFCLATSDSDFTRLAMRLRESGMSVIGMGESKTPEPFRVSCEKFLYLDILFDDSIEDSEDNVNSLSEENAITPLPTVEAAIARIITDNGVDGSYMDLGELGNRLTKWDPSFDTRNYGYAKFSKFLEKFDSIELRTNNNSSVSAYLLEDKLPLSTIESDVISILSAAEKHTLNLGTLSQKLCKIHPTFSSKNYGYKTFGKMVGDFKSVKSIGLGGRTVTLIDDNIAKPSKTLTSKPKTSLKQTVPKRTKK